MVCISLNCIKICDMKVILQCYLKFSIVVIVFLSGSKTYSQLAPDVIVQSLTANYDGQTAILSNINYTVQNQGNLTTFSSFVNEIYVIDIGSNSWFIGDNLTSNLLIAAGATESLTIPSVDLDTVLSTSGTYYLKVVLDVNNDVTESDETNNIISGSGPSGQIPFVALVGLKENKSARDVFFKCYPNTVNDHVNVSFSLRSQGKVKFEMVDIAGKIVMSIDEFENNTLGNTYYTKYLDTSHLKNGFYICRLISGNTSAVEKLIVQH